VVAITLWQSIVRLMKKYIKTLSVPRLANAQDKDGSFILVREMPLDKKIGLRYIEATDMAAALVALNLTAHAQPVVVPPAPKPRALTKRELVDKLIELGVAAEFNALLGQLPLEEKLRWEASPSIHPEYPFLVQGRDMILTALGITGEQFDSIFI
jgi:hypothetical protein